MPAARTRECIHHGLLAKAMAKFTQLLAGKQTRLRITLGLCLFAMAVPHSAHPNDSFDYVDVVEEARLLAAEPFSEPEKIPEFLQRISYDQWRDIRFKPQDSLWRADNLPFEVQFFHTGSPLYDRKVQIHVVEPHGVKRVPFSPDLFHYGMNEFKEQIPEDLGFAGFRLHYPINTPDYRDEVIVFLGASYLRALGREQRYGLSARGLAIDTAAASGEEFPYFKKFLLVRPQPEDETMNVFALLDSPSLTGAYQFTIQPGKATLVDVAVTLFARKEVNKLGIAPLNSMFFYGENTNIRPVDDFRPEVHDSDGISITTATDEWIWRPLINPRELLVTSFQLNDPKGFGLLQRDIDFDHYQDLEADYQMRPSTWITPKSGWGEGRVELVQIPTDSEVNDNIVSYWVPSAPLKPGAPASFSYQMKWGPAEMASPPNGRVVATRTAAGNNEGARTYLIDFDSEKLRSLPEDTKLTADIAVGGGELIEQHLKKNSVQKNWRLVFQVKRKKGALDLASGSAPPLELRAFLRQGNEILTETWSYVDP